MTPAYFALERTDHVPKNINSKDKIWDSELNNVQLIGPQNLSPSTFTSFSFDIGSSITENL